MFYGQSNKISKLIFTSYDTIQASQASGQGAKKEAPPSKLALNN
jgi:hypothetical protein